MKKTLFVTMLAAALLGGQGYATVINGYTEKSPDSQYPPEYFGQFSETESVTGGDVTISEGEGDVPNLALVFGGYTWHGGATGNSVAMSGGEVGQFIGGATSDGLATGNIAIFTGGSSLYVGGGMSTVGDATYNTATMAEGCTAVMLEGGQAQDGGNASHNTVFMSGGTVEQWVVGGMTQSGLGGSGGHASNNTVYMTGGYAQLVFGGLANDSGYDSKDNVVVMTGGEVGFLAAAAADCGEASGNEIHLVGLGASYTIDETPYAGSMLTIQSVSVVDMIGEGNVHGNSANVYGTGIDIEDTITGYQQLNFHLVDAQAGASVKPMLTLGGALDLTGVEITFYADAVVDWTSFEGKTITLAQAEEAITGLDNPQQVNIMNDGTLLTTATLALADDGKLLQLTVPGNVPEPATGTLSLLALAGLCVRRRRK